MIVTYQFVKLASAFRRGFFMPAIRSGLLGRDVLHDTSTPYTRRALNQIAGLAQKVERLPWKQDVGGSIPSTSTRTAEGPASEANPDHNA